MKAVILNDTSKSRHFGCQTVMEAYHRLLSARNIEVIGTQFRNLRGEYKKRILDRADIILINGEGSIHHDKHLDLLKIGEHYPSILMNCVFQSISENMSDALNKFKLITVRESYSAEYMENKHGVKPLIVPDLMFSMNLEGIERTIEHPRYYGDSTISRGFSSGPQIGNEDFVNTLAKSADACLGRFHGICLAAMLGIPFSAWRSNTWKNEGIMHDMGISDLYAEDMVDALELVPQTLRESVHIYVQQARHSIDTLFDTIANEDY